MRYHCLLRWRNRRESVADESLFSTTTIAMLSPSRTCNTALWFRVAMDGLPDSESARASPFRNSIMNRWGGALRRLSGLMVAIAIVNKPGRLIPAESRTPLGTSRCTAESRCNSVMRAAMRSRESVRRTIDSQSRRWANANAESTRAVGEVLSLTASRCAAATPIPRAGASNSPTTMARAVRPLNRVATTSREWPTAAQSTGTPR